MTAVAQVLSIRPASPAARVASYLVDLVAVAGVGAVAFGLTRSWVVFAVVVLEAGVVLTLTRATTGRSPGALATRTVALADGTSHAPGLRRQSLRSLVMGVLHLSAIGPVVTVAVSRDGRDWVDRLAGTAAVDTRPVERTSGSRMGVDPYGRPTLAEPGSVVVDVSAPRGVQAVFEPDVEDAPPRRAAMPEVHPEAPEVYVVLDSGTRVALAGVTVFGRDPQDETVPSDRLVAVPDPGRSLSRTHVRIGVDASGIWVEDAYSANGTWCRTPDGQMLQFTGGQRVGVVYGTVVGMGDRTMTITSGG